MERDSPDINHSDSWSIPQHALKFPHLLHGSQPIIKLCVKYFKRSSVSYLAS